MGSLHWNSPNIEANNESEFNALPGGRFEVNKNQYNHIGSIGFWWSRKENDSSTVSWGRQIFADKGSINTLDCSPGENCGKNYGFSVRCIKDNYLNTTDQGYHLPSDAGRNNLEGLKPGTEEYLLKEAYQRMQYDLRASHIFIRLKPDASSEDTMVGYRKATMAREKIMKGASFEDVVLEFSEDPSAKDREATQQHPFLKGNKGDLGYFAAFDMVYAFENGAWDTEISKVTLPVRTEYGYHLIKVTDRRPALGKVTVAHIFLAIPKNATADDSSRIQKRIESVYQKLVSGETFEDLVVTYSEDKGSAAKGGVLPPFGVNRMVPDFVEAIYSIQNIGDYTKPILTSYGWHIVKLVDKKQIGSFEEEKEDLLKKISKDSRGNGIITESKIIH